MRNICFAVGVIMFLFMSFHAKDTNIFDFLCFLVYCLSACALVILPWAIK